MISLQKKKSKNKKSKKNHQKVVTLDGATRELELWTSMANVHLSLPTKNGCEHKQQQKINKLNWPKEWRRKKPTKQQQSKTKQNITTRAKQ